MDLRHTCSLYHDVQLFYGMFRQVNKTKMYHLIKLTIYDLLARLSMLMAAGLTAMLTIEKPRKQALTKNRSKNLFHTVDISPKICLFSNKVITKEQDGYTILSEEKVTDLAMLYTWLSANEKATQKYIDFYLHLGFDVIKVHTTVQDAIQPESGTQISANHVVNFLNENKRYNSIIVHGMSIGGYAFGEALVKVQDNLITYEDLPKRFTGLVFDSGVDYRYTSKGLSKTLTKNEFFQKCIELCFNWFLKINHKHATRHYERSSKAVRLDFLKVPTLFIGSKVDLLSEPRFIKQFAIAMSDTRMKCFDESPHIQHYRYYPEQYEAEIKTFLKAIIPQEKIPSGL